MELITTHTNSDFDSLGAMVAAKLLYPGAVCVFPGSQETTLRRFFLEASSYTAGFLRARDVDLDAVTKLIVVDADGSSRIGAFGALVGRPGVEIHVYDHHPEMPDSIPAAVKVVAHVGAATTILVEILKERGIPIREEEATMMLLGIFEDTGSLTFTTTTPRDFFAAGYLAECGADLSTVREFITPELTAAQVALLDDLLKNRVVHNVYGLPVTVTGGDSDEYVGDLALLAHKMCDMESLGALVAYARMGDRVHMVLRSRVPEFDGSVVARHFGGGGHPEAASASIRDMTPLQIEEELVRVLPLAVKPRLTARELMGSPAKTIESGRTVEEARELLNRYHVNGLPVMKGCAIVGVLTRLVVERALSHGLGSASVDEYMTSDFSVVDPAASLERVREIVVGERQRLVPVVEEGRVVGVVTRTDLLHALTPSTETPAQEKVQVRNAGRLLGELVDREMLERLREVGHTARELGMEAYLVGGIVRDLVLRARNQDVDIVVEGDGILLAERLAAKWGGVAHPHRAFGTAKIKLPGKIYLDVATARTEYYTSPAALPTVEKSSLKLDLSRRDFTINALALRLDPDRFGEIVDFFGGLRDLKERSLRILHNLSFVEDPTRVLRAIRFSKRFGFTIGGQTRRLLRSSVAEGFVTKARGPRLFKEWRYLFEETDPAAAAEALAEEGILKSFHPKINFDEKVRGRFESVREVVAWHALLYLESPPARWKIYFLALLEPLSEEDVLELSTAFAIEAVEGRWFVEARKNANSVLAGLRRALSSGPPKDSEICRTCREVEEETLLFAMARTSDTEKRRAISRYHTTLAAVRTLLTGDDLKALGIPPGPDYRKILGGLLDARLDGTVKTRADEENFVLSEWRGITGKK